MFSAYAYHNQLTSVPEIRYQFPLTPTATDMSSSPVDSPFLSPAPSLLEAARPSITERQHVTSGVCTPAAILSIYELCSLTNFFLETASAESRCTTRLPRA